MLMHVSGSGYHALRLLAATPGMDGDTLRAVICSGAFSALCSWAAPVQRCHCECYSSVPGQLLDILDRQLERCGPANLTSTRVVERCSDWSPFLAGFALGALAAGLLGLTLVVAMSRSRRPAAPAPAPATRQQAAAAAPSVEAELLSIEADALAATPSSLRRRPAVGVGR